MSKMLIIERRLLDDPAPALAADLLDNGGILWRHHSRTWNTPIDWTALLRHTPGQALIVTHSCGRRAEDGSWLDGPIIALARDGSIAGAIPSGGPARLELPVSSLDKPGAALKHLQKMEERAAWRCLLNLVAALGMGAQDPLVLQELTPDLRAALVLVAARQIFPKRSIVWPGPRGSDAWQRLLHNAGISKQALPANTPSISLAEILPQITTNVVVSCVAGANRQTHIIPAALIRDGYQALQIRKV